jgi:hypothetical protein
LVEKQNSATKIAEFIPFKIAYKIGLVEKQNSATKNSWIF